MAKDTLSFAFVEAHMDFEKEQQARYQELVDGLLADLRAAAKLADAGSGQPLDAAFEALADAVGRYGLVSTEDSGAYAPLEHRQFLRPLWRGLRSLKRESHAATATSATSIWFLARLTGQMDLIRRFVWGGYVNDFRYAIEENGQSLLEVLLSGPKTRDQLVPAFMGDDPDDEPGLDEALEGLLEHEAIRPVDPAAGPVTYEITEYGRGVLADLRVDP